LKIGGYHADVEGLVDSGTRLSDWQIKSINTRVGNEETSKDAKPEANFTKFGKTFLRNSARHCNFAGDDCWNVRVHPKIDEISASAGYLAGGQQL